MKYIFFFRGGKNTIDTGQWSAWINELKKKEIFIEGSPLLHNGKIVSDNGQNVRDFHFDIAENANGFVIIKAANMDEAITLSKNCPIFTEGGNITIRPVEEGY